MAVSKSFYKNVYLLTQYIQPHKEFERHFKEGLFDKPNMIGFIHVSYYLLNIYDEERFKKLIEWPLLDKRSEADYRSAVKDFLIIISKENEDIDFPPILPSNLLTASGIRFVNIMWKLSQVVIRVFLRRKGIAVLAAPKSGDSNPITKVLFKNSIVQNTCCLAELDKKIEHSQNIAKLHAKHVSDSIKKTENELYEAKEKYVNIIENIHCSADTKKRLLNLRDEEIFLLWKNNLVNLSCFMKSRLSQVKDIERKSTKLESLVLSLFSDQRKVLDGINLPVIDADTFSDLQLDPAAQVALHHLYVEDKLVLNNLFIIFVSLLPHMISQLKKDKFPNLTECNEQIIGSIQDFKSMCNIIESLDEQLKEMSKNIWRCDSSFSSAMDTYFSPDEQVINSALLKSSPTLHLCVQKECENDLDSLDRLKLTPIEGVHRTIFGKYGNNKERLNLMRPKLTVSRINFDDTLTSNVDATPVSSNKKISINKNIFDRSINENKVGKKFARLFNPSSNLKATNMRNSVWKVSNVSDRRSSGIFNLSEIRAHLINSNSTNGSFESSSSTAAVSSAMKLKLNNPNNNIYNRELDDDLISEKSVFNSTTISTVELGTINELNEISSINQKQSDSDNKIKSNNGVKRRHSLKELVDRYNKIKESSLRIPKINIDDDFNENFHSTINDI